MEPVAWYVIFIFSVTLHEAAHAWIAKLGGDLTAYEGGQVSIDPIPHIRREPIGMIALPVLTLLTMGWPIGFASAPYDPVWAANYPKRSALMALGGPLANLCLVILSIILIRAGMSMDIFIHPHTLKVSQITMGIGPGFAGTLANLVSMLFSLNLILFVFNLIPLPPLDGSGLPPLFLKEDAARRYMEFIHQPMFSFIALIFAWKMFDPIFKPIFFFVISMLYPGVRYV